MNHRFAAAWQNRDEREKKWITFHQKVSQNPYEKPPQEKTEGIVLTRHLESYFLTMHSRSNPFEDQATFAEYMMNPQYHLKLLNKILGEKNPDHRAILEQKYICTMNDYREWSNGAINDEFWNKILAQGLKEIRTKNQHDHDVTPIR